MTRCLRNRNGFTLAETLVAIVVLMILLSSIYGAYRVGSMSVTRTEQYADAYQTVRILLGQITSELYSTYQPSNTEISSLKGEDTEGDSRGLQHDTLSFLTTGHGSPSHEALRGDVCRVTYTVRTTSDGEPIGFYLIEEPRPGLSLDAEGDQQVIRLSETVVGFNCEYLDSQDEWLTEWIDRQDLPKAVRIELAVKPEQKGAKPILVAATANLEVVTGPGEEVADEETNGE